MTTPADSALGRTPLVTAPPVPASVDGLVARLVTQPDDPEVLTLVRTVDVRTAVARGLKEYLEQKSIVWEGGRQMKFKKVMYTWSEPEDPAQYPSLVIVGRGDALYDGYCVTSALAVTKASGRFLREVAELEQFFDVIVWTADPNERMGLTAMLEDALEPNDWMTGVRLELPYYFGTRATYDKQNVSYDDTSPDAQRRWRRAVIRVQANVPQYVVVGEVADMQVRSSLEVLDAPDA